MSDVEFSLDDLPDMVSGEVCETSKPEAQTELTVAENYNAEPELTVAENYNAEPELTVAENYNAEPDCYECNPTGSRHDQDKSLHLQCKHCCSGVDLDYSLGLVGMGVCRNCMKQMKELYSRVSQTTAMERYCLTSNDLLNSKSVLAVTSMPNPRGFGNPMKLYYEFQLRDIAVQKHGSIEEVVRAVEKRKKKLFSNVIATGSQCFPETSTPRKDVRAKTVRSNVAENVKKTARRKVAQGQDDEYLKIPAHQHVFGGDERIDETLGKYAKRCLECGYIEEWEEI
eukprot:GHVQ01023749.1.p2 GENE.GHVQ01023749.1~~GHVQ01023749.1.p2  ORF type:complete len:284 (-),score=43.66 GHVQ01023749.1:1690-2541(-)